MIKKRLILLTTSYLATSLILFLLLFIFSVKTIEISGEKEINGIHMYDYDFLPLIDISKVESEIYSKNPSIKNIKVVKKYPSTLVYIFEDSIPVAELSVGNGVFLLNDAGRIFQISTAEDASFHKLTRINYYQKLHEQEYSIGDEIDKQDLRHALVFLGRLKSIKISIETIDITSPNMIVLLNAQQRYLITIEKDIELQFQELKVVYERLLQKGEKYSQIDVRFEKPIITF